MFPLPLRCPLLLGQLLSMFHYLETLRIHRNPEWGETLINFFFGTRRVAIVLVTRMLNSKLRVRTFEEMAVYFLSLVSRTNR